MNTADPLFASHNARGPAAGIAEARGAASGGPASVDSASVDPTSVDPLAGGSGMRLRVLAPGRARRLPGQAGARLTVIAGRVWLTESGIDADRFVGPGQSVRLEGRGRVVVETVGTQSALIDCGPMARAGAWRRIASGIAGGIVSAIAGAIVGAIVGAAARITRASGRITGAIARITGASTRVAGAAGPPRSLDDPALGALSEWQLRDIGAPEALIVSARARDQAQRRWRDTVLGDRHGCW